MIWNVGMLYRATIEGETVEVELDAGRLRTVDGQAQLRGVPLEDWTVETLPDGFLLLGGGQVIEVWTTADGTFVASGAARARVEVRSPHDVIRGSAAGGSGSDLEMRAPMPGKVVKVAVSRGDKLTEGDLVLVIEAMKMQNELRAAASVSVASVEVKEGQSVEGNELLVAFEPAED